MKVFIISVLVLFVSHIATATSIKELGSTILVCPLNSGSMLELTRGDHGNYFAINIDAHGQIGTIILATKSVDSDEYQLGSTTITVSKLQLPDLPFPLVRAEFKKAGQKSKTIICSTK